MTCVSMLGSGHRADFWTFRNQLRYIEVPLCSEHLELVKESAKTRLRMCVSEENVIYLEAWMDSCS